MAYTHTPEMFTYEDPHLEISKLCISQINEPYIDQDGKFTDDFKYRFSCICNDLFIEFDFEQEDQIHYGQFSWEAAIEKWLLPYLRKNVLLTNFELEEFVGNQWNK